MKKKSLKSLSVIFTLIAVFSFCFLSLGVVVAQEEPGWDFDEMDELYPEDAWEEVEMTPEEIEELFTEGWMEVYDEREPEDVLAGVFAGILGGGILIFSILFFVASYVYFSLAYMRLAQKLNTEPAWLAWIPVANVYLMSKMAKMHWWPVLLIAAFIIPFINILAYIAFMVFFFIWNWKIFEKVNRPGWWPLMLLIPVVGALIFAVLLGMTVWGKNEPAKEKKEAEEETGKGEEE